jgi:hypothetical protein
VAMSEENVELVPRGLVATSGGDPNGAQAMFDPSIEWDMAGVGGWPEKRLYRGAEVGEFLRAWADCGGTGTSMSSIYGMLAKTGCSPPSANGGSAPRAR